MVYDGSYRNTSETRWSNQYYFLQGKGYVLRPRYHPDWTASWLGTNRNKDYYEDSVIPNLPHILDATQPTTGRTVCIKWIRPAYTENERAICEYLRSPQLSRDPTNHCVPVIEFIPDESLVDACYLVMPLLRPFNDPEFMVMGEVVEFIQQILDGLQFMHKHGVAHRDCVGLNIMMDATTMYPNGWHPIRRSLSPDMTDSAHHCDRIDANVKYFFIDFGISARFLPGQPRIVSDFRGREQRPPELVAGIPHDPFKIDMVIIGYLLDDNFYKIYADLHFLSPLINALKADDPARRPTAEEALAAWNTIRRVIDQAKYHSRLRKHGETLPEALLNSSLHAFKGVKRLVAS
ncbi:hypothetical protein M405DRAFT_812477 [Rhizopogon salebrosus TDB-379]|nr:hypothetical protein M405DRAFT_812477 [Rhizopogon salebrosus TDB-379]